MNLVVDLGNYNTKTNKNTRNTKVTNTKKRKPKK